MRFRIGDIFEIPLPDKRKGYAKYLFRHRKFHHLIQVLDFFTDDISEPNLSKLNQANPLFPPVFTILGHAVNREKWHLIKNSPVENFTFPKFLNTFYYLTG